MEKNVWWLLLERKEKDGEKKREKKRFFRLFIFHFSIFPFPPPLPLCIEKMLSQGGKESISLSLSVHFFHFPYFFFSRKM